MRLFNLSGLIKFLFGILVVQIATGALVYAALRTEQQELWLLFGALAFVLSLLAGLWFSAIVHQARKDEVAHIRENFSRQKEKIKLQAEKDKAKVMKQTHRQLLKDRDRTQSKANMKVGASFAGVMGLGLFMMFTQFVTIGMLTLTTAGGALAGYAFRTRQDYLSRQKDNGGENNLLGRMKGQKAITAIKDVSARLSITKQPPKNPR